MHEKIAFQTNVPVTVALAYADGVQVEGRFGDQIMYTQADVRVMYVPPGFYTFPVGSGAGARKDLSIQSSSSQARRSLPGRIDTSHCNDALGVTWPCQFRKSEISYAVPPIRRTDNGKKRRILVNLQELAIAHRVAVRREVTRKRVDHPQNWFHQIISFRLKTGLPTAFG
jgi:hypothetical protein